MRGYGVGRADEHAEPHRLRERRGRFYEILRRNSRGFVSSVDCHWRKGQAGEWQSSVTMLNTIEAIHPTAWNESLQINR